LKQDRERPKATQIAEQVIKAKTSNKGVVKVLIKGTTVISAEQGY